MLLSYYLLRIPWMPVYILLILGHFFALLSMSCCYHTTFCVSLGCQFGRFTTISWTCLYPERMFIILSFHNNLISSMLQSMFEHGFSKSVKFILCNFGYVKCNVILNSNLDKCFSFFFIFFVEVFWGGVLFFHTDSCFVLFNETGCPTYQI